MQIEFLEDHTFEMQIGNYCFMKAGSCKANGVVTDVTNETITVEYTCTGNAGCFCNDTESLTLCWKYSKQAMDMRLAAHYTPTSMFSVCPNQVTEFCDPVMNENVGLGILECTSGACVLCRPAVNCNNRGKCDKNGKCNCFPGISGDNCNISACPGDCYGHGICDITKTKIIMGMSIFDESKHTGVCRCVSGWSGADCSTADIYTGRQALWQGLIFVGVVSTVLTFAVVFKKFSRTTFHRRSRTRFSVHRRSRRQQRTQNLDVELDEFINPL